MTTTLVLLIAAMLFIVIVQVARMNDLTVQLKDPDQAEVERDGINGSLFLVFMVLFLGGITWSLFKFLPYFLPESASKEGVWIDSMFNVTCALTGVVFVGCHIALFYFAWRYKYKKGGKAFFYPENNTLEMWWTIVPAIVMTGLVIIGIYRWFEITAPAPSDAQVVEIAGKQFNWMVRYPGKDGQLGNRNFKFIDDVNAMGVDFSDPHSKDDFMPNEIHFIVDKPAEIKIWARDVIHNVGMPHFRMKMDAMPGIPTRMKFTPTITTARMREITGNPNFNYELACDQLCGNGHYSMRMIIVVESKAEFDKWAATQVPVYESLIKGTPEEKKFMPMSTATNTLFNSTHSKIASKL